MCSNVSTKGEVSSFFTLQFSCEPPSFQIGTRLSQLTIKFHEAHHDVYCTFLAPSIWINLPTRVTHKPKYDLLGSLGLW